MGMRPPKMCAKCHNTAVPGSPYCTAHRNSVAIADAQRKAANPLRKLYWTKLWRVITRSAVLVRDPRCAWEEDGPRCWALATEIDHIVDAAQWVAQGHDFYDLDNLRGLCKAHHNARKRGQ